jgi:hypothetical protein
MAQAPTQGPAMTAIWARSRKASRPRDDIRKGVQNSPSSSLAPANPSCDTGAPSSGRAKP